MGAILETILHYGKQPSTWGGIAGLLLAWLGIEAKAVYVEQLQAGMVGVISFLAVVYNERKKRQQ